MNLPYGTPCYSTEVPPPDSPGIQMFRSFGGILREYLKGLELMNASAHMMEYPPSSCCLDAVKCLLVGHWRAF
jgi:hypothetical protein